MRAHGRARRVGILGGDGVDDALVLGVDAPQVGLALRVDRRKPRAARAE
jgi:hypothetical protein